jgi:hypothetical protein
MVTTMFWSGMTLLMAALVHRVAVRMRRRRILMHREIAAHTVCRRCGARN